MSVILGQASKGESGYHGQIAGNQGAELNKRAWYSRPWDTLIRAKDTTRAELIARAMEDAINNRYIGYDQSDRLSLYIQAHLHNWSLKSIITPVECDCSSLVAVCLNCAGIPVPGTCYTGNLAPAAYNTGMVDIIRDSAYLTSPDYLRRGDILLNTASHVVVVLTNGSKAGAVKVTPYAGVVTVSDYLNVRTTPGGSPLILGGQAVRLPNGMVVAICEEWQGWGRLNDVPNAWISLAYVKR